MPFAKKSLGQNFLHDENVLKKISDAIDVGVGENLLEIGPGRGALTKYLLEKNAKLKAVELDDQLVVLLREKFPALKENLIHADVLELNFMELFEEEFSICGNFPYNISSPILFKVLESKQKVTMVVGMFQKEVAKRIAGTHGSKEYGILSVLMQCWFEVKYLFDVTPESFSPQPKIMSGVLKMTRRKNPPVVLDEKKFVQMVKAGFNQRRKMLRNALAQFQFPESERTASLMTKRAEHLSVDDFVFLSNEISKPHTA